MAENNQNIYTHIFMYIYTYIYPNVRRYPAKLQFFVLIAFNFSLESVIIEIIGNVLLSHLDTFPTERLQDRLQYISSFHVKCISKHISQTNDFSVGITTLA